MKRGVERARDLSVGIVVALAAVVFAAGIFSIGSESRLWTRKVPYKLRLPNTGGLNVGSPVTLAGVQVGTVTDINLPSDPNRLEIDVDFSVDAAVQKRIREDTTATLKILTMLAGDKYLELTPGSPKEPVLPPGSYVRVPQAVSFDQMQELGANIAEDLKSVTTSLSTILAQIQDRNTFLGQIFFDPDFGKKSLANIRESLQSTRDLLHAVANGKGLASRVINDQKFADDMISKMQDTMDRMDALMVRLGDQQGTLMKAMAPDGPVQGILDNLQSSTASMARITDRIDSGEGIAGRLLKEDRSSGEILDNMRQASRDLRDVMSKINSGEGTAGAFVNDPTMYQDLRDVLRGVRESRMMSWLIRHYQEKGEKARLKELHKKEKSAGSSEEGDA